MKKNIKFKSLSQNKEHSSLTRGVNIISVTLAFMMILFFSCSSDDGSGKMSSEPGKRLAEYSADKPGKWKGKEDGHAPYVKVIRGQSKNNIIVYVNLKDFSENHYIERIGIMDENKKDLAGISYSPKARSSRIKATFSLSPVPTAPNVKVYVKCSQHDLWTAPLIKE